VVFNIKNHIFGENLYKFKCYGAKKISKFPDEGVNVNGLNYLLTQLGNQEVDDVRVCTLLKTLTL